MRLSIGVKLIGGFLITIGLLLAVFGTAYVGSNTASQSEDTVFNLTQEDFYWAKMQGYINREISYTLAFALTQKDSYIELQSNQAKLANDCVNSLANLVGADRKAQYDQIVSEKAAVEGVVQQLISAYKNQGTAAGNALLGALATANNKVTEDIAAVNEASHQAVIAADAALSNAQKTSNLVMIIITLAAVLIAVGLALWISRSISSGTNKIKKALKKMAQGDLTEKVLVKSKDEIGDMARSYNETQERLNELISKTKENALQLSSASDQLATAAKQSSEATQQVSTSSQQMAKGAQEQSSSAQETAKSVKQLSDVINQLAKGAGEQSAGVQKAVASITEVSETMSKVAQNANQAAQGAKQAVESAKAGAENSKLTLEGMNKIKTSTGEVAKKIEELGTRSAEIGKIVAVIDDIAAQTNLLALNAAIEAARAGEQGRGFAVVSDEVRKLAERSAMATKEIADLIGSIQKGVDEATQTMAGGSLAVNEGCELVVKSGQSLEEIAKVVDSVNTQIEQISAKTEQISTSTNELVKVIDSVGSITEESTAATEEMSASASEVSKAVETVAGIAEENSAATEEVSASAEEMSAQVEEIVASAQTMKEMATSLEQSVALFKVKSEIENILKK